MAHIDIPAGDDAERLRMWQLVPWMADGIDAMRKAVYGGDGKLTVREQEVARIRIAQINDCDI